MLNIRENPQSNRQNLSYLDGFQGVVTQPKFMKYAYHARLCNRTPTQHYSTVFSLSWGDP
jgi:hypothetical protein